MLEGNLAPHVLAPSSKELPISAPVKSAFLRLAMEKLIPVRSAFFKFASVSTALDKFAYDKLALDKSMPVIIARRISEDIIWASFIFAPERFAFINCAPFKRALVKLVERKSVLIKFVYSPKAKTKLDPFKSAVVKSEFDKSVKSKLSSLALTCCMLLPISVAPIRLLDDNMLRSNLTRVRSALSRFAVWRLALSRLAPINFELKRLILNIYAPRISTPLASVLAAFSYRKSHRDHDFPDRKRSASTGSPAILAELTNIETMSQKRSATNEIFHNPILSKSHRPPL